MDRQQFDRSRALDQPVSFIVGDVFPQELLIIRHLDDEWTVEDILKPLAEDKGDKMPDVHGIRRGTPTRVQEESLSLLFTVQDGVEISVRWGKRRRSMNLFFSQNANEKYA